MYYVLIAPNMTGNLATFLEGSPLWAYYAPGRCWVSKRELTDNERNAARAAGGRNSTHIVIPKNNVVNSLA